MNQMKYLAFAFLWLLALVLVGFLAAKIFSTELVANKPTVVDYIEPTNNSITVGSEGKSLFYSNCATCHALDKVLTGPALRGVENRGPWIERKNTIRWIKNPAATIKRFNYTKQLVEQYGGQIMPAFPQLTAQQIEAILDYLKQVPSYQYGLPVAAK